MKSFRPIESPEQVVESDWEYGFDYSFGPCEHGNNCPNPWSILHHCPEWIGKKAAECSFATEYFRIPIQRRMAL